MKSILFLVETIQCKEFRWFHGKNKKTFSQFFCAFFKYTLYFKHFQSKMTLIAYVFPKLKTSKDVVS